jgi:DNA-binding LacI/PurR family transcriptional regulator
LGGAAALGCAAKGGCARFGGEVVKLIDVARAANVAVSTASRALNNPSRVNSKTRSRVESVAAHLGYSTNMAARSLRMGSSRMVMVIMPPGANPAC